MRRSRLCAVLCLTFVLLSSRLSLAAPHAVSAEVPAAAGVRGKVVDPSGGAVAGARVTLTADRAGAGAPASTVTNVEGEFAVQAPAGTYTVRVEAPNFVAESAKVTVTGDSTASLDVTLQVAGMRETVTVGGTSM